MARRAGAKLDVVVPRGFPPFDPRGLRLFGDRGAPLLPRSMMEVLGEQSCLLRRSVVPVGRDGSEHPCISLEHLFWTVFGARGLKAIDPHATVDRAFQVVDDVQIGVLDGLFVIPERIASSDLLLADLPMSPRLRAAWRDLLDAPDTVVADTADTTKRALSDVGGGWSAAVEWAVLLEHCCVDPESFGLFQDAQSALSLDLVSELVAEELVRTDGNRLPREWASVLRRRKGWGVSRATLDALGMEIGVTRERIRQLESRVFEYSSLREWPMPALLGEALEVALDSDVQAEDFGQMLVQSGVAGSNQWNRESLADLCEAIGRWSDAQLIRAAAEAAEQRAAAIRLEDGQAAAHVRRARSHMGFVNVSIVDDGAGGWIPAASVLDVIGRLYSRVASVDGWVLAGGERETAAENAALVQLAVAERLPVQAVVDGLDRVARKRHDVALPPADVVISLLTEIGCLSVEDGMASPSMPADLPEQGSNDRWLYDLLNAQPDESMHADDVLRVARAEGRSEASIGVHLTYSPIVRRVGGVVSLVGADLDPADRARIKRVANARRVDSDYTVEWTDRGPVVTLTLGTAYLTSAVVGMRRDLLESVKVSGLSTACCRDYRSDARLGISGLNAVYGWTTLFHHWVSAHGVSEGDEVRVLLGETSVATLEPWAQSRAEPTEDMRIPTVDAEHVRSEEDPHHAISPASLARGQEAIGYPPRLDTRPVAPAQEPDRWEVPVEGVLLAHHESTLQEGGDLGLAGPVGRQSAEPIGEGPELGSASHRQRGEKRLTLSMARQELVMTRDGSALSERYGPEARDLAQAWLRIRPTGGRVWVDDDGFATTLMGEQVIVLGRLPAGWTVD